MDSHAPPVVGASQEAIDRGHETDPIDPKPFIRFTLFMLVFFVGVWYICFEILDFSITKHTYASKENDRQGPLPSTVNPLASERNEGTFNQRIAKIDTYNPQAKKDDQKIYAPRLEFMRQIEQREGEPPYLRTFRFKPLGNSPEFHPEDLHADKIPGLHKKEWVDKAKGVGRLPIGEVIALDSDKPIFKASAESANRKDLPASKQPKLSNSGRGIPDSPNGEEKK